MASRGRTRTWLLRILTICLSLVSILIVLLLFEIGLRIFAPQGPLMRPHPRRGWTMRPGYETGFQSINSAGFCDVEWQKKKPEGVFRIAALGDSFGWEGALPRKANFFPLLEEFLNLESSRPVEILNFCVPGYGPDKELDVLSDAALDYEPDAVLLLFYAGNDITDTITGTQVYWHFGSILGPTAYEKLRERRLVFWSGRILQHSHLYWFIRNRLARTAESREAADPALPIPAEIPGDAGAGALLERFESKTRELVEQHLYVPWEDSEVAEGYQLGYEAWFRAALSPAENRAASRAESLREILRNEFVDTAYRESVVYRIARSMAMEGATRSEAARALLMDQLAASLPVHMPSGEQPEFIREGWRRTEASIRRMSYLCRERKLPFAIVMVPSLTQVNADVQRLVCAKAGVAEASLELSLPQERVEEIARTAEFPCLDLRPRFLDVRRWQSLYCRNDTHWNRFGIYVGARRTGIWLVSGPWASQLPARDGWEDPRPLEKIRLDTALELSSRMN